MTAFMNTRAGWAKRQRAHRCLRAYRCWVGTARRVVRWSSAGETRKHRCGAPWSTLHTAFSHHYDPCV